VLPPENAKTRRRRRRRNGEGRGRWWACSDNKGQRHQPTRAHRAKPAQDQNPPVSAWTRKQHTDITCSLPHADITGSLSRIHTFVTAHGTDKAGYQESAWDGGCCPTHCANDSRHVSDVSRFRRVVDTHDGDVGATLVVITPYLSVDGQLGIHRVENPHLPTRPCFRGQFHLTTHETRATANCRQSGPHQPPLAHQLHPNANSDDTVFCLPCARPRPPFPHEHCRVLGAAAIARPVSPSQS